MNSKEGVGIPISAEALRTGINTRYSPILITFAVYNSVLHLTPV